MRAALRGGSDYSVLAKFATALATVLATFILGPAPAARADDQRGEARAHYEKGTAAYALGRFADAAAEFEQAFTLKPDPALLYNAAQAYRLAGDRDRALQLYKSYLRVFGRRAEHSAEADFQIGALTKVSAPPAAPPPVEHASLTAPPPAPLVATSAPLAAPPSAPTTSLVTPPTPAPETERPLYQRWWFWTGVGAVVVGAVVVGVMLATRKTTDCGPGVDFCANTGL